MARRLSRRKRTTYFTIAAGAAAGLAAWFLWPRIKKVFQQPTVTAGTPTLRRGQNVAALLE